MKTPRDEMTNLGRQLEEQQILKAAGSDRGLARREEIEVPKTIRVAQERKERCARNLRLDVQLNRPEHK